MHEGEPIHTRPVEGESASAAWDVEILNDAELATLRARVSAEMGRRAERECEMTPLKGAKKSGAAEQRRNHQNKAQRRLRKRLQKKGGIDASTIPSAETSLAKLHTGR